MTSPLQVAGTACGDDHDPTAITTDAAKQLILKNIEPLPVNASETVSLRECLDRVLADDIVAVGNVPPYNNAAMDGYALNAAELPERGVKALHVIGSSFAGHPFLGLCGKGECVRIMTGGMLPEGLDTVIPQEHVEVLDEAIVRIDARTAAGDNVRAAGEDIRQGQSILKRGRRINAADLGLIASLGLSEILVMRRLRVAFFSTGDELRAVGETLQPGEIHDSNRYTVFGMLRRQHCELTDLGIVRDNPEQLRAVLLTAAAQHDVIISSGGVSVGEADYVRQVFQELGEMTFWKVAMKPGRPLAFGRLQQAWFFGLPGNPVAVMVSFNQFVQAALQRLSGEVVDPPLLFKAVTSTGLKKRAGRTEYQRGVLNTSSEGKLTVCKTGEQGSGILTSMSRANCFIVLPSDSVAVAAGDEVWVQPFAGFL